MESACFILSDAVRTTNWALSSSQLWLICVTSPAFGFCIAEGTYGLKMEGKMSSQSGQSSRAEINNSQNSSGKWLWNLSLFIFESCKVFALCSESYFTLIIKGLQYLSPKWHCFLFKLSISFASSNNFMHRCYNWVFFCFVSNAIREGWSVSSLHVLFFSCSSRLIASRFPTVFWLAGFKWCFSILPISTVYEPCYDWVTFSLVNCVTLFAYRLWVGCAVQYNLCCSTVHLPGPY